MKTTYKAAAVKTDNTPFAKFTRAMDGLMSVPHSEIKKALDKEKRDKARKKRAMITPASGHASDDKG